MRDKCDIGVDHRLFNTVYVIENEVACGGRIETTSVSSFQSQVLYMDLPYCY